MKLVAPDIGAVKMAGYYAKHMDAELVVVDKRRPQPNLAYVQNIIGDVKDRNMVILDDLIDTAGSMCAAAEALKENGAKDIYACSSHALLSRDAVQKIEKSSIKNLIITDTIPLNPDKNSDKIKVISTASMVGEAIKRIHFEQSISSLFV
jgi:ribose-phosphate pyrophosphokinase